jgi:hypothetical protein
MIIKPNKRNSGTPLIGATMLILFMCMYFPTAILEKKSITSANENHPAVEASL